MKIINTICQMCRHYCGMHVFVHDGKIVKIEGIKEHPVNKGSLCAKGLAAIQLEYDPKRLKYPMKRVGGRGEGKWERISWDEALDTIASKLKEIKEKYGAHAVAYYRGQAPRWGTNWFHVQRFMNVFGSPNICTHSHLCHVPRQVAHVHTYGGMPIPDFENTKCIVLWGYNPTRSSTCIHARRILDSKEKGAKLIVIDPRFTEIASKADIHVQLRPGTDGALALGMMNVIINEGLYDREFVEKWTIGFDKLKELVKDYDPKKVEEITWVSANEICNVAKVYATNKPAVIEDGNGLDQHTNVVQTTRAIAILRAITGNLDIPGGNVLPVPLRPADITLKEKLPKDVKSISAHPLFYNQWFTTTPELLDAVEMGKPYPIRAVIVQGGDPIMSSSNSKKVANILQKLDFLVVHDLFMTATAELADIVLPAATFLESTLVSFYPFAYTPSVDIQIIGLVNKVIDPLGDSWPDTKFIFELARRLGYEEYFPWRTIEEALNEELAPMGLTIDKLKEHPEGIIIKIEHQKLYKKYEREGFKTPSKKVEIYSPTFEQLGYDPLPTYKEPAESPVSRPELATKYPLLCGTCLKLGVFTHTQFRTLPWLNELFPEPFIEIHPQKADELGIKEGDIVVVESPRGSIEVKAKLTEGIDPRVIMISYGWGQPYAHGSNVNLLTDDLQRCPVSAATGNRSILCSLRKKSQG
jgi:anaerobic selenocysteine-containing dehydrogenase